MPTVTDVRQRPAEIARTLGIQHYRDAIGQGINLSQLLEREDPTSEYPEGDEARDLDAFERVLRELDIVVNPDPAAGRWATSWEDATKTPEKRAAMMEFAARVWRQTVGYMPTTPQTRAVLLSGDAAINTLANMYDDDTAIRAPRLVPPVPISALVARTEAISGVDFRSLYITDALGTDAYRMKRVNEGAEIPMTKMVTGEHTLRIHKYGRGLLATYEQLRRQRIDRIAFIIARMAIQAEVDKVSTVMNVIISGDGNANTAAVVLTQTGLHVGSAAGTLTLQAWLTLKLRFGIAYTPNTLLAQEASLLQLALLPISTGNSLPLAMAPASAFGGIAPINTQWDGTIRYGITADAPALKFVIYDRSQAIERVTEIGGNVSEAERYITNQTQVLTMTEVEGYGVIDPNASRVFNLNA